MQTNRDVVCQIFSSDIKHDVCIASAYSHELKRYGLTVGLTNYAAAYATALLLARRVNHKFSIGYKGNQLVDGKEYHVKDDGEGMAPFRALLDVGLARTTTGARVFGALKGALRDGFLLRMFACPVSFFVGMHCSYCWSDFHIIA